MTVDKQKAAFTCFLNFRAQVAYYIAVHPASKNLDAMVGESMRDIPSDEEPSGDENDPELLVSKLLLSVSVSEDISGFLHGVAEISILLRSYMALVGS